jgi:hypothetical protein
MTETTQLYNLFCQYQIQDVLPQIQEYVEHDYFEIWKKKIKSVRKKLKRGRRRILKKWSRHNCFFDLNMLLCKAYNIKYEDTLFIYQEDEDIFELHKLFYDKSQSSILSPPLYFVPSKNFSLFVL